MPPTKSSLYPLHPPGTQILISPPENLHLSKAEQFLVYFSSLFIVGSLIWVPALSICYYKKWKNIPKNEKQKRNLYGSFLLVVAFIVITGPHRSKRVGEWFKVREWRLWKAWLKYVAYEVVTDVDYAQFLSKISSSTRDSNTDTHSNSFDFIQDQAIMAVIPHGVFPFSLAFAALPEIARNAFGRIRPVVATATAFFPYVNTFLSWLDSIDASRSAVNQALNDNSRIGLSPGGISEMFVGYPNPPNTHPNDECALIKNRKGFIRLAIEHQIPVIPVYCFGATKMLKRLELPLLEKISKLVKISICLFFGRCGLPIPFRQRLLYVMGNPIFPPELASSLVSDGESGIENTKETFQQKVDLMHDMFCEELIRIFEKYKESYGWDDKTLQLS